MIHDRRKKNGKTYIQNKSLTNRLRWVTDTARDKWWDKQCLELDKHEKQGKTDLKYRKVSQLTNKIRKKQSLRVHGKEGKCADEF